MWWLEEVRELGLVDSAALGSPLPLIPPFQPLYKESKIKVLLETPFYFATLAKVFHLLFSLTGT